MRLLPRRRPKTSKLEQAGEETLTDALASQDPGVRDAALDELARRPDPTAEEALLDAVVRWPYPQEYAALERALTILVERIQPGWPEAFARKLVDPSAPDLDERHHDALAALIGADPRGDAAPDLVADAVAETLDGHGSAERPHRVLAWLGDSGAEAVRRALDADAPELPAIEAAGVLRDARAVDPLVKLLGAPGADTRSAAATALGRLNDTRAVQALIGATQDPEHGVRQSASEALNAMGVAAVIVGVASVMREAVREQLAAAGEGTPRPSQELAGRPDGVLPAADPMAAHPPTWTQEVLGRLLRRMGGQ